MQTKLFAPLGISTALILLCTDTAEKEWKLLNSEKFRSL
jgi:hypothetical protein